MKIFRWTGLFLVFGALASVYATEGINLIGIGPRQQGTAGAGVAAAQDSTWIVLNPAGLANLEPGADVSFQLFGPSRTIRSTANPAAGKQKDDSVFYIPSISAVFPLESSQNQVLGLGLYGSSGMGVDYDHPRVGFSDGDSRTELAIAKFTAAYARSFDSGFSIGAGPVFVLGRFRTDMETSRIGPPSSPAGDDWDDAPGVGAIIGANQKINDRLRAGISYTSEQFMEEYGDYENLFLDSLNLPQQVTAGLAFRLTDDVELVLDYRWIGWGDLETFGDQFGWEDQHIVKAGAIWQAGDQLTLRTGISHGNSPIGREDVFANALFPAIMETHVTAGATWRFERFALHAAFIHGIEEEITASGPPEAGGGTTVSMVQNSFTAGASWTF
ncbi:MAG TPA: outer membrane protein transport protein [Kiritimatiellia bacterium]|nr:outer membrane protein transport protein [Kiritimatiellia bacterium]HNS81972.1 outer membrane protein transport protein [Kiritimatiellia bacterium]